MNSIITDRRQSGRDKSVDNRRRFLHKVRGDIKKVIKDNVINGKVSDIIGKKQYEVKVNKGSIYEPDIIFQRGSGDTKRIHVGNKEFVKGDLIPKPQGEGHGDEASQDGEGEDDFSFVLSQDEFIELFFDDLELPNLLKSSLLGITKPKWKRGGISKEGAPSRLNLVRTFKQSIGRNAPLEFPLLEKLKKLEKEQEEGIDRSKEIEEIKKELASLPFLDDIDLRYNRITREDVPIHRAVMFCLMDVSGSMQEWEKEVAKRFFTLLYLFLNKAYKEIEIRFIRYHSVAKEVDEEEFFYSKESGGTVLSPALDIVERIIHENYDSTWNMYICHASDGDNYHEDNPGSQERLMRIIPQLQFYAYVQVVNHDNNFISTFKPDQDIEEKPLWQLFVDLDVLFPKQLGRGAVTAIAQIWPVFQKLFEKEGVEV